MNHRPILFSAPMVQALLAGRKSQTRRIMKPQPHPGRFGPNHPTSPDGIIGPMPGALGGGDYHAWDGPLATACLTKTGVYVATNQCPYGQPGDLLWVRETWAGHIMWDGVRYENDPEGSCIWYRADGSCRGGCVDGQRGKQWRPSIHMPKWASRLTLMITDVRVERLQDISEADAIAEGVQNSLHLQGGRLACENFAHLWWTINGDGSWEANPWVWVISFEVIQKNVLDVLKEAA